MADSEHAMMSGGQSGAAAEREDSVEMKKIDPAQQPSVPAKDEPSTTTTTAAATAAATTTTITTEEQQQDADASAAASSTTKGKEVVAPLVEQDRTDSLSIGAADAPSPNTPAEPLDGPVCNITLLLPTGARHPYKIDDRYLSKRNVEVPDITESGKKDPFSISVYKLKELILREWRDEWDGKPASPSSIRLIHFGKLLDDKEQLRSKLHAHQLTPTSPSQPGRDPCTSAADSTNTKKEKTEPPDLLTFISFYQSTVSAPKHQMSSTCLSSRLKCWRKMKPAKARALVEAAGTTRVDLDVVSYYKTRKGDLATGSNARLVGTKPTLLMIPRIDVQRYQSVLWERIVATTSRTSFESCSSLCNSR